MNIPGRYTRALELADVSAWRSVLSLDDFWSRGENYDWLTDDHANIASFRLIQNNAIASESNVIRSIKEFDSKVAPAHFLRERSVREALSAHIAAHTRLFGAGTAVDVSFTCIGPGGSVGYHVDGNVYLAGERIDLTRPEEWDIIEHIHSSHRTILPIRVNADDDLMVSGKKIPLVPGYWFELNNILPHAYFNRGKDFAVLLIATYKVFAEQFQPSLLSL